LGGRWLGYPKKCVSDFFFRQPIKLIDLPADLFSRAVHFDVSPLLTNNDMEEAIDGIRRVFNALE
jgi:hypothetical protein